MSSSVAIASVTATLRDVLLQAEKALVIDPGPDQSLNGMDVVMLPPKKVILDGKSLINLFLYDVQHNAALRNLDIPARSRSGDPPPITLALDLYYLVSAYGMGDDELLSQRLLGRAMTLLQNEAILPPSALSPEAGRQFERIRITPHRLSTDDMSKLWTMFATEYRLSVAYVVSVVLIDALSTRTAALPVLGSQVTVFPDLGPTLSLVTLPGGQTSAVLGAGSGSSSSSSSAEAGGDLITLVGEGLSGDSVEVVLRDARGRLSFTLTPLAGASSTRVQVALPDPASGALAGPYFVQLVVFRLGHALVSNEMPVAVAPRLLSLSPNPVKTAVATKVTATFSPPATVEQRVALLVAGREVPAQPRITTTDSATFDVGPLAPGTSIARLRVDGVDSHIPIDTTTSPPSFAASALRLTIA